MLPFTVTVAPGRDLPADIGLSGKVVRRFGGASSEKSGRTIGCGGGRTREPGELGRDPGVVVLRTFEIDGPDGEGEGAEFRRAGVDGLEADQVDGEFKFGENWDLEVGVEGLEF